MFTYFDSLDGVDMKKVNCIVKHTFS